MKSIVKAGVFRASRCIGVNRYLRRRHRSNLLVLCYHGVVSEERFDDAFRYRNAVSVGEFEYQLETLGRMFRPVSAGDIVDSLEGRVKLPDRSLLITFDDGFRNNLTCAAPILERFGIPAVFHVTTGYLGEKRYLWTQEVVEAVLGWGGEMIPLPAGGEERVPDDTERRIALSDRIRQGCKQVSDERRLNYLDLLRDEHREVHPDHKELYELMSWDDVRALKTKSFEIGSHTVSHPILSRLDTDRLRQELRDSKARIEKETGDECNVIAYPNGGRADINAEVVAEVERAGYRLGFTLLPTFNATDLVPLEMNRVCIVGQVPSYIFHSRISGLLSLFKWS